MSETTPDAAAALPETWAQSWRHDPLFTLVRLRDVARLKRGDDTILKYKRDPLTQMTLSQLEAFLAAVTDGEPRGP